MRYPLRIPMLVLGGLAAQPLLAATFCATTSAQLEAALATAAGNGQHDAIRVHIGNYDVSNVDLVYDPSGTEDFDLDISGGWVTFFENPCGVMLRDPWQTTLDGGDAGRILRIGVDGGQSDVSVRQLVFLSGHVDSGLGGGLEIHYGADAVGTVTIERNVFVLNSAAQAGALSVQGPTLEKITNNLFLLNEAGSRAAALLSTTGLFGVSFTNNTVVSNTHTNSNQPTVSFGAGRVFVANNNFWNNDGYDASLGSQGDRFAYNNNYNELQLAGGEILENNLSVEPEYESGLFNFTPVRASPLVDAGREPEGSSPLWDITDVDLNASMRLVGPHVDIGAFENERIFVDGFDPSGPFGLAPDWHGGAFSSDAEASLRHGAGETTAVP